ncbi:MAG: hypothetical protein KU37_03745 [Sulfuricurvum sp. PC08-66]|nr:MAG: hypothetical protein KU37_03745 [Sulfuricurvum sp. PC08-66]
MRCFTLFLRSVPLLFALQLGVYAMPVSVGHAPLSMDISSHVEIATDEAGTFTIDAVRQGALDFAPNQAGFLYFHFSHTRYWLKLDVINTTLSLQPYVLHIPTSWLDRVQLYHIRPDGTMTTQQAGDHYLRQARSIDHKDLLFEVPLSSGENRIYVALESLDAMQVPLYLVEQALFAKQDRDTMLLYGFVFGVFVLMALYNLFYFLYTRDRLYGIYALYILFFGMMTFSVQGFGLHYFWSDALWLNERSYNFFLMGYLGFMVYFANEFLQTKNSAMQWNRVLRFAALFYGVMALLSWIAPYALMMELGVYSAALIPFIVAMPALVALGSSNIWARFYIIGWLPNISLYTVWALGFFGFLPYSLFVAHANTIGVLIELLVFSFAMVYRIQSIVQSKEQLEHDILIDALTGIKNRYAFSKEFAPRIEETLRVQGELYFAIVDVDHFKRYNDAYGHPKGDEVLRSVAQLLKSHSNHEGEAVYRLGGEEFGIVWSQAYTPSAPARLEALRQGIMALAIPFKEVETHVLTASIGMVRIDGRTLSASMQIYKKADEALYEAKELGRNRVVYRESIG